jgi:hypothetical protein
MYKKLGGEIMKFKLLLISFISFVFLISCSERTYDKNEVIAIFEGTEIKVSDILTLYPVNDEYIEIFLKEEIVIHEAKKLGITVSEQEMEEQRVMNYPSVQIEDFHKEQAEELGITAEEYLKIWSLSILERNVYVQKYIKFKFDEPSSDEEIENWGSEIEAHINNLFTTYKENKELIIN